MCILAYWLHASWEMHHDDGGGLHDDDCQHLGVHGGESKTEMIVAEIALFGVE